MNTVFVFVFLSASTDENVSVALERVRGTVVVLLVVAELLFLVTSVICVQMRGHGLEVVFLPHAFRFSSKNAFLLL